LVVPFFFVLAYNALHLPFRLWGLTMSYNLSDTIVEKIANINFQRTVNTLKIFSIITLAIATVFYFWAFAVNMYWVIAFVGSIIFAVLWACAKKSNVILFYIVIFLCVGFTVFYK
ncbi:hypothetical protein ACFL58_04805, partial [Elusimicrobiota bacterium]